MKKICKSTALAAMLGAVPAVALAGQSSVDITATVDPVCTISAPSVATVDFGNLTGGKPDSTTKTVTFSVTCNGDSNGLRLSSANGALVVFNGTQPAFSTAQVDNFKTVIEYEVTASATDTTNTTTFTCSTADVPDLSSGDLCASMGTPLNGDKDPIGYRLSGADNLSLDIKLIDEGIVYAGDYKDTLTVEIVPLS